MKTVIKRWREDVRFRVNVSLMGTFLWNVAYGVFQIGLGYYSLAGYYILLAFMRFFLVCHSRKHLPGEKIREEWQWYRACGILFLVMNLMLTVALSYMIYQNRVVRHHEITTIALATYTFFTFVNAIVNVAKYRKYESPVFSATKIIAFTCACVSMFTLENTMLVTFDDGSMTDRTRRIFLILTVAGIFVFIVTLAIYMIIHSTKKLRSIKR